jgi:hypothetical protein
MVVLIVGLIVSAPVGVVLMHQKSTWLQATGGTLSAWWMIGFVFYVVIVDMKKRWPHIPLKYRWGMLFPDAEVNRRHDEFAAAAKEFNTDEE